MKMPPLLTIHSFRLRIALLSVVVSGVALAVFSGLAFAALHRISMLRVDENIREFAHRHLVEPPGRRRWERISDSLRYFLGNEEEGNAFILLVKGKNDNIQYLSPNWPKDLPVEEFPDTDAWGRYPKFLPPPGAPRHTQPPPIDRWPNPPKTGEEHREPVAQLSPEVPPPPLGRPPLKVPEYSTREAGGEMWRVGMMGNPDLTIVLGLNLRRLHAEMSQVCLALLTVFPIALLFVAAGAWWMSQRALKPIEVVTRTIKQVKSKGLEQRVREQNEDREFSELISVFNDMMDWLEKSFHQAIRFSADASHELKTPLTVLQAQLEQAVHEAEPGSEEQQRYVAFGKELQRLKSITQKLLLLSRIDAGELKLNLRPLNFTQLMAGIVEDTETLAPQLNVESELVDDLWVLADAELMKQVVQNLATNAIKFNHKDGFIKLRLHAGGDKVRLSIANSGQGIPPEDRDKVFARFFRGDKAHGRRIGGAGLGLSLAREIVRAHQGELVLESSTETATVFSLTLPKART